MRTSLIPVFVSAMLVVSSGQSALPRTAALSPPSATHATQSVPFNGTLDGTVTVSPLYPPLFNVLITAGGRATHLGRFTVEIPHVVNFATATGEGTFTFTAANGDTLTAEFTGVADTNAPMISIVEHATITGGTGRFADVTGTFIVQRLFDPVAQTTSGSFEGTLTK